MFRFSLSPLLQLNGNSYQNLSYLILSYLILSYLNLNPDSCRLKLKLVLNGPRPHTLTFQHRHEFKPFCPRDMFFIHACECVTWTRPHLDVLGAVHLLPLLLQLLQNGLQRALHRRLGHLLLLRLLLQLGAEAFGQSVAALTGQRRQVLLRLHQLAFCWGTNYT